MSWGILNFSQKVIDELVNQNSVNDLITVLYNSLIKSIELSKNKTNFIEVDAILAHTRLNNKLKDSFYSFFHEMVFDRKESITNFNNSMYYEFLIDLFEKNIDFPANNKIVYQNIINNSVSIFQKVCFDSLSEKQDLYFVLTQNTKILKELKLTEEKISRFLSNINVRNKGNIDKNNAQPLRHIDKIWNFYYIKKKKEFDEIKFGYKLKDLFVHPVFIQDGTYLYGKKEYKLDLYYKKEFGFKIRKEDKSFSDIFYIKGEPGVGKSTFIKYWVANLEFTNLKFIVIELNKCIHSIKTSEDLLNEIKTQLSKYSDIAISDYSFKTLLGDAKDFYLIIDGLDEFNISNSNISKELLSINQAIQSFINDYSDKTNKIFAFLFGRPIAIDMIYNSNKFILLELLPLTNTVNSYDFRKLLVEKFDLHNKREILEFCTCQQGENQYEITTYPLLLSYLLSDFKNGNYSVLESSNKYDLYEKIFKFHYKREYIEKSRDFEKYHYFKMLSTLAHSAWIKGSVRSIEKKYLKNSLKFFLINIKENLNKFLLSQYVVNSIKDSDYLEFSHKSFGEFFLSYYFIDEIMSIFSKDLEFKSNLINTYNLFSKKKFEEYIYLWLKSGFNVVSASGDIKSRYTKFFKLLIYSLYGESNEIFYKALIINEESLDLTFLKNKVNNLLNGLIIISNFWIDNKDMIEINKKYSGLYKSFINKESKINSRYIFKHLNLESARLNNSWLENLNMYGINLKKASLVNANLKFTNLKKANLENANLEGANLEGANLEGANLKGVNFKEANLEGANLNNVVLTNANLFKSNLEYTSLVNANLANAKLLGANLEGAELKYAIFVDAELSLAILKGANLKGVDFTNCKNLTSIQLSRCYSIESCVGLKQTIIKELLAHSPLFSKIKKEIYNLKK